MAETTKTDHSKVEELKQIVTDMDALMSELSKFGAADSEPDGVFQSLLMQAIRGKDPKVPTTADGWELYSMHGAGGAARRLASKARQAVTFIGKLSVKDIKPVEEYLTDLCWRVG
jgi:hypothetical protein